MSRHSINTSTNETGLVPQQQNISSETTTNDNGCTRTNNNKNNNNNNQNNKRHEIRTEYYNDFDVCLKEYYSRSHSNLTKCENDDTQEIVLTSSKTTHKHRTGKKHHAGEKRGRELLGKEDYKRRLSWNEVPKRSTQKHLFKIYTFRDETPQVAASYSKAKEDCDNDDDVIDDEQTGCIIPSAIELDDDNHPTTTADNNEDDGGGDNFDDISDDVIGGDSDILQDTNTITDIQLLPR